ncbi:double-headed protease inhibitor, submandibular gland-like [Suricata suricatta]|nr:double-headed protease inhibitor, submandibular gland-like [Suricata suricatta]
MKNITVFAIIALAATTWAASPPGIKEVDCSKYNRNGMIVCSRERNPMCGIDHQTYSNECMFCQLNQNKGFQLRKLHDGECDIECRDYSVFCTMEYVAHCGSDGEVYPNKCSFCNAVVKRRGTLFLAKHGECESP